MNASRIRLLWSRAPIGFIGMLLAILLVESFLQRNKLDFKTPIQWDWDRTARTASRLERSVEILCFGDSLVKEGLVPQILEQRLGTKVHNLAVNAGTSHAHYFLLKRVLESGARPRAILFDLEPHLLMVGHAFNYPQWPVFLDEREGIDLAYTARDLDFLAYFALGKNVPSIRYRDEIRANLLAALEGRSGHSRFLSPPFLRNWRMNQGAQIMPRTPTFEGEVLPGHMAWFPPKFEPDPVSVEYVNRFLKLASTHGIPVYWLLPPIAHPAQAKRMAEGLDADHLAFVRSFQEQYPNVVVIDARLLDLENDHFHDPFHLNRDGALMLSGLVADVLNQPRPPNLSWLTLLDSTPALADVPFEDLDESRIAQRTASERRR